ncbi:MAG TPA: carboxypeptidase-like regulatory domain-containing protein [Thermoanaerobaculia bacterium]|nr:carboxypeptidase-like regulatory domain-containing protein [Thermoanaerobaculia bacterium]
MLRFIFYFAVLVHVPLVGTGEQVSSGDPCVPTAVIDSIELSKDGLWLRSATPLEVAITEASGVTDPAIASFGVVTVEIQGAAVAVMPAQREAESGPFVSMRVSRFRQPTGCGIRIRLQARDIAPWVVDRFDDGRVRVGPRVLPLSVRNEREPSTGLASGGAIEVAGDFGLTGGGDGDVREAYRLTVGFSQALSQGAVLRGFFGGLDEPEIAGSPFGAVAISNLRYRDASATIAAGDLLVGLGGGSTGRSRFFNGLLIRGGALAMMRGDATLETFGGRAARATLYRIPGGGGVISEIGDDRIFGSQLSWAFSEHVALGGGWVTSLVEGEPRRNNLFQSVELDRSAWDLRVLVEESLRSESPNGYAVTVDPTVQTERLSLSGFYRYRSAEFEPALASGYFASLRRSYGLSASWRAADRLSLSGSAAQLKSFSLLDPLEAGTLTSTSSVGARWQATQNVSLLANHHESSRRSDSGVFLGSDSRSSTSSLGSSFRLGAATAAVRVARQAISTRERSLVSDLVDGELTGPIGEGYGYARITLGDPFGDSGDRELGVSIGGRAPAGRIGSVRADLRYSELPAGIFFDPARQFSFQLGVDGGVVERILRGSVNLHYSVAERASERQSAWGLFVSFGHLVDWGAESRPDAPFATRALPLESPSPLQRVIVSVRAFLDADADGVVDSGEQPLAGIRFRIDGRTIMTNAQGIAEIAVPAPREVALQKDAAVVDLFALEERRALDVVGARAIAEFAFRPAGRVSGRVAFHGEGPREWIQSIRVTIEGEGIRRETVTGPEGDFNFGSLPAGRYALAVDTATLAAETRMEGASNVQIAVRRGELITEEFTLRRATARERFGIQP